MVLALLTVACGDETEDAGGYDDNTDWSDWDQVCNEPGTGTLSTGTTWQWQLTGIIDHSVDVAMYDIDLFNTDAIEIAQLKQEGRTVICYFSAGTWEEWRSDAGDFDPMAIGETMEEWEDEKWLDVRHESTRAMATERLDLAVQKGCDGVEPDNMDGYANNTGFTLTGYDQLDFNRFVAVEAHARGLSVGLRNDVSQISALEGCFDWALNEECFAYEECGVYSPFLASNKAVFHVEYVDDFADAGALADEICGDAAIEGFSTLVKDWDLTEEYRDCL